MIRHFGPVKHSKGVNAIGDCAAALDKAAIVKGFGRVIEPVPKSAEAPCGEEVVCLAVLGTPARHRASHIDPLVIPQRTAIARVASLSRDMTNTAHALSVQGAKL